MLRPEERRRFNQIVERLYAEDPAFTARVVPRGHRRSPAWAPALSVSAGIVAPLPPAVAGWDGVPLAMLMVAVALTLWHVHSRRTRHDRAA